MHLHATDSPPHDVESFSEVAVNARGNMHEDPKRTDKDCKRQTVLHIEKGLNSSI